MQAAQARGSDVLIVDTAGRLHTKQPLMEELKKVRRVIEKAEADRPDETLLVLDATTGQNGIAQARAFTEAVEVTGVALTKLDGTAKGGVVLAVRDQLGVPVKARRHRRGRRRSRALRRARPSRTASWRADVARAEILIVEDHPTMREAMRLSSRTRGSTSREASDGRHGAVDGCASGRRTSCSSTSTSPGRAARTSWPS